MHLKIFSGIYGVGKAAEHPPALAVLSHKPDGATQTIAWVGKGIVYDTGGLSIKGKVYPMLTCAAQPEKYAFYSVSLNLTGLSTE